MTASLVVKCLVTSAKHTGGQGSNPGKSHLNNIRRQGALGLFHW